MRGLTGWCAMQKLVLEDGWLALWPELAGSSPRQSEHNRGHQQPPCPLTLEALVLLLAHATLGSTIQRSTTGTCNMRSTGNTRSTYNNWSNRGLFVFLPFCLFVFLSFCLWKEKHNSLTVSGVLGPLAILANSLLVLLPDDSSQRGFLCGLLIQVSLTSVHHSDEMS